jgi:hypothetical protein
VSAAGERAAKVAELVARAASATKPSKKRAPTK